MPGLRAYTIPSSRGEGPLPAAGPLQAGPEAGRQAGLLPRVLRLTSPSPEGRPEVEPGFALRVLGGEGVGEGRLDPETRACACMEADTRRRLPFADAAFDAVEASPLLSEAFNPRRVLREVGRVLRPGGRLRALVYCVVGTTAEDFAFARLAAEEGAPVLDRRLLREVVAAAGLRLSAPTRETRFTLAEVERGGLPGLPKAFARAGRAMRRLGYEPGAVGLCQVALEAVRADG